jgi:pyridoxal phosphate enzyme (YggS family)
VREHLHSAPARSVNAPCSPPLPVAASGIGARLRDVRERIERAANGAGRDPSTVRLVAVSKTFGADAVRAAAGAGQIDFGENRVQEALEKMSALPDLPLRWHLVGHLQANKARKSIVFNCIHSIDGVELLRRVDRAAAEEGHSCEALVQVDLAGEPTKHGATPSEVEPIFRAAEECGGVKLAGLMVLPPFAEDPEGARPYFRRLRDLRDRLAGRGVPASMLRELSMGMSQDFEVAIEEGATMVRVGTAIFGGRG